MSLLFFQIFYRKYKFSIKIHRNLNFLRLKFSLSKQLWHYLAIQLKFYLLLLVNNIILIVLFKV